MEDEVPGADICPASGPGRALHRVPPAFVDVGVCAEFDGGVGIRPPVPGGAMPRIPDAGGAIVFTLGGAIAINRPGMGGCIIPKGVGGYESKQQP